MPGQSGAESADHFYERCDTSLESAHREQAENSSFNGHFKVQCTILLSGSSQPFLNLRSFPFVCVHQALIDTRRLVLRTMSQRTNDDDGLATVIAAAEGGKKRKGRTYALNTTRSRNTIIKNTTH
jgi:hypothetical protein